MTDNILDERIDTGYRDLAGNTIYIGSRLSNPKHERYFDVHPGIVKVDHDGRLIVYSISRIGNGCASCALDKHFAADCLVIPEKSEVHQVDY